MKSLDSYRLSYSPNLPTTLKKIKNIALVKASHSALIEPTVAELLPHTKGLSLLKSCVDDKAQQHKALRVGVVLSGGQAAGGHNVITGLYDALRKLNKDSEVIGFLNGPSGIIEGHYKELTKDFLAGYRNQGGFDMIGSGRTKIESLEQLEAAKNTVQTLNLDGLVVIGGDDSNTNAAFLAEFFIQQGQNTTVVGVPKTIDGDLKNQHIEISFGFDTATKVYSEVIGNIERDALSAGKYYFFVKLMGRSASHIALECALKTRPNYTIIGEEVFAKQKTIEEITNEICDIICYRATHGKNHGVILIPEGTIEFVPEFGALISEINDVLAKKEHENAISNISRIEEKIPYVTKHLGETSKKCYENLPSEIQVQLILDRDPHGNVNVSKIETERLFIELVKKELNKRKKSGLYTGSFSAQPYFCGYEGRSGLPSNFDAQYCYALGHVAALLINAKATGYMACLQNLAAPVSDWVVAGIPISTMMVMEKRKGKLKAVIQKALVNLKGRAFERFKESRAAWALEDDYQYPGAIQYFGPEELTDQITITLQEDSKLKQDKQAN